MKIVNQKKTAIINVDNVQMVGLATVSDGRGAVRTGNLKGTEVQTLGTYRDIETAKEVLLRIARMPDGMCFGMPAEDWTPQDQTVWRADTVTADAREGTYEN